MKIWMPLFAILMSCNFLWAQESKTIKGRVISEELGVLPYVLIYSIDTTTFGYSDYDGNFVISVPAETSEVLLKVIGMEWTHVKFKNECDEFEVVMMLDMIYDFISIKRINRKRYRRYKQLPKIHQEAFEQGIFQSKEPCLGHIFDKY